MAFLAYQASSMLQQFKGTQYQNPDRGTHRVCLRTGTGKDEVIKYGLTSNVSASAYCGIKFKVMDKDVRIGRYEMMEPITSRATINEISSLSSIKTYSYSATTLSTAANSTSYYGKSTLPLNSINQFYSSLLSHEELEDEEFFISKTITKQTNTMSTLYGSYKSSKNQRYTYISSMTYKKMFDIYLISSIPKKPGEDNFNL